MKIFFRSIPVYYWHAEAIVKKRVKNFMDTRVAYFDGPTKDEASKGLQRLIFSQNYRLQFIKAITEHTVYLYIPFWHPAYWSKKQRHNYMVRKGFFQNYENGEPV